MDHIFCYIKDDELERKVIQLAGRLLFSVSLFELTFANKPDIKDFIHEEIQKGISKAKNIAYREIGGVVYIITPSSQEIHQLNDTGVLVWNEINGKKGIKEIVATVARKYDKTPKEIEKDVIEFLNTMKQKGIIRYGDS